MYHINGKMLILGETVHRAYGNSLLSSQFFYKSKPILKENVCLFVFLKKTKVLRVISRIAQAGGSGSTSRDRACPHSLPL